MVYHKSNKLGTLKFFVYLMGIVLMLGVIALVYIIYKQNWIELKGISAPTECHNSSTKMIVDAEVQSIAGIENKMILITMPKDNMQKIIVFDYCQNQIINDLSIEIRGPSNIIEEDITEEQHAQNEEDYDE